MSETLSNLLFAVAALGGRVNDVKQLLEAGADPKANDSRALRMSARNGHLEMVKLLLPVSDPEADDSLALRWAAENGHLEIVELLLPHSDHAKPLNDQGFVASSGCDLLLSCLPSPLAKKFMADNPSLNLPRTIAMLAARGLSSRNSTAKSAAVKPGRGRC